jgi:hypothetical protein
LSLSGQLADFGVAELLQILSMGKKSGVLAIEGDQAQGQVYLNEGRLVHAADERGLDGEAAFRRLAANRSGRFSFTLGTRPDIPTTIRRPLQTMLLEQDA